MEIPLLNGLVLAGGKSLRMGSDKGQLHYYGKPQRKHLYELLRPVCSEVFISCNAAQAGTIDLPDIADAYPDTGPMGGILSAMEAVPGRAWLVLACDMPYLSSRTIAHLITHRSAAKAATVFASPQDHLPEPLAAIWEPVLQPVLLQALQRSRLSLRDVLKQADVEVLPPPEPQELQNINDAAAFAEVIAQLNCTSRYT